MSNPFTLDGFLDALQSAQTVAPENIRRLKSAGRSTSHPFDVLVTELGVMRDTELCAQLAQYFGAEIWQGDIADLDNTPISEIGIDYLADRAVLPVEISGETIRLCLANPFDTATIETIGYYFEKDITIALAPRAVIKDLIAKIKLEMSAAAEPVLPQFSEETFDEDLDRLQDIALEAPVVNFVNRIAQQAFEEKATDIHIEPLQDKLQVRFRKDGILSLQEEAPKNLLAGISTRIKILARMNIVERRLPQDGRIRLSVKGQEVDYRVSSVPSIHGETLVLRLLHNRDVALDLAQLGYEPEACDRIEKIINAPNGMVVITGPTGSGKTTTLYAMISRLNREGVKIFTIEDPVEYRIDGVTQLQVNAAVGLDFAKALRSILRQDPDIILVGEIRDKETAQIAIQAALTGHLVLTTLHTNSAAGALSRLADMGVEPYLTAATLRGIIAQRLARRLCDNCEGSGNLPNGHACPKCRGSTYSGRQAVYEIMEMDGDLARMVGENASEAEVNAHLAAKGVASLKDCGEHLVEIGKTSRAEIMRILNMGGDP